MPNNNLCENNECRDKLTRVYEIIDQFDDFMEHDIIEKTQTLYLSKDFESLRTAKGLIGEILNQDQYEKLVIEKLETRTALKQAYRSVDDFIAFIPEEIKSNEEFDEITNGLAMIRACIYECLNLTYGPELKITDAIANIVEMSDYVINMLDELSQIQQFAEKVNINKIKEVMQSLKPVIEVTETLEDDDEDTDHESTQEDQED